MRKFENDLIFWYGLNNIARDDMKLRYMISMEKDYILQVANVTFAGMFQYALYKAGPLNLISDLEMTNYSAYITENYDRIYKCRYRYYKDKPTKISLKKEDERKKIKEVIESLILPYYNQYCFKSLDRWKHIIPTYIAALIFNFEYDINHISKDNRTKTSCVFPFLFTLNIVNVTDRVNLYKRVRLYFDRKKILKKYHSYKNWKEKDISYLNDTILLLDNEEEWSLFLANFSEEKWSKFTITERYKTLFELSKVVCILIKDRINSVTMLGNGDEQWDILKSYLPLFIYDDQVLANNEVKEEYLKNYEMSCAPFSFIHLNSQCFSEYIASKSDRHCEVDDDLLRISCEIVWTNAVKIKILKLAHEYIPYVVNSVIENRKKLWVNILGLFKENLKKPGSYIFNISNENDPYAFYFLQEEMDELKNVEESSSELLNANSYYKLGRVLSLILGLNKPSAKVFGYDLDKMIKYSLTILGTHPNDTTIVTNEFVINVINKFKKIIDWYGDLSSNNKEKYAIYFELPYRLLEMKKN